MIGNDIIDLDLAKQESHWQRRGFLPKIFTPNEQLLISKAVNPEVIVWYLWSLKEAAYKIYNRQTEVRAFMPLQLHCFDMEIIGKTHYGKVRCYDQIYFTKTYITTDFIDTVAVLTPADFEKIEILDSAVVLQKKNGIPSYFTENAVLKPLSKSHHGRFERIVTLVE